MTPVQEEDRSKRGLRPWSRKNLVALLAIALFFRVAAA